jgi:aspartokinase
MEHAVISGIAHDTSEVKVTIRGLSDEAGIAARVFSILAGNNVSVDMIIQNASNDGLANISFTFPGAQKEAALEALQGESGGGSILGSILETAIGILSQKDRSMEGPESGE